jgi:hypothetical protein
MFSRLIARLLPFQVVGESAKVASCQIGRYATFASATRVADAYAGAHPDFGVGVYNCGYMIHYAGNPPI